MADFPRPGHIYCDINNLFGIAEMSILCTHSLCTYISIVDLVKLVKQIMRYIYPVKISTCLAYRDYHDINNFIVWHH